ncbi:hypothetical protein K438DRAFT_1965842 [Mycena galopus ATCC 62051]|nr:hypothetical protein K438DRAFT_1965842 [Mycena galopus ATCC 62051]
MPTYYWFVLINSSKIAPRHDERPDFGWRGCIVQVILETTVGNMREVMLTSPQLSETDLEVMRRICGTLVLCLDAQLELKKQDTEVGFSLLNYSMPHANLVPPRTYFRSAGTGRQASLALDFLIAVRVKPQNLQLVGDSSAGHLILQALSQIIHPHAEDVPEIHLPGPLRGIYLISP